MKHQELLERIELLKKITKDLPAESKERVIGTAVRELSYLYLKGKSKIPRSVYNAIGQYFLISQFVTKGERIRRECKKECAQYTSAIEMARPTMLHVDNKPLELVADFSRTNLFKYIPEKMIDSSEFKTFVDVWDWNQRVDVVAPYWRRTMDISVLEKLKDMYPNAFHAVEKASHEFYEEIGYYTAKKNLKRIWKKYNELGDEEREDVTWIKVIRLKGGSGTDKFDTDEVFCVDIVD